LSIGMSLGWPPDMKSTALTHLPYMIIGKGSTMEITRELRTLAKFTSETMPVLCVYLNTQWRDQHQRERVTTFLERHLRQAQALESETPEALESLTRDLGRLTQWGQQQLHNTGESPTPG